MDTVTAPASTVLGLSVTFWDDPIAQTLLEYGAATIADATNERKLKALARYQAWKAISGYVSFDYDYSEGGASYKRSQMQDQATRRMAEAFCDCMQYLPSYQVSLQPVDYTQEPYTWHSEDGA